MARNMRNAFSFYLKAGFSVIPVGKDKRPLVSWEKYQKTRATEEEVNGWFARFGEPNVAIVTGELSNLFVVDCDSNEAIQKVEEIMPDNIITPVCISPRGGQHYYFRHCDGLTNRTNIFEKVDVRTSGGYIVAPPSMVEDDVMWYWKPGLEIHKTSIQEMPQSLLEALIKNSNIYNNKYNNIYNTNTIYRENEEHYTTDTTKDNKDYIILQNGSRDNDLFHIANSMTKGGSHPDIIEQVLEKMILSWGENPDPKWITAKIKSAMSRAERRERNLSDEVREFCLLQEGYFLTTDLLQMLQITTKEEKKNLTVILSRLSREGIIEKYGEKRGCYRRKTNTDNNEMDLTTEPVLTETKIRLPIGLDRMCILSPGNIAVVAGSKSSGKTAFVMNVASMNQDDYNIIYLNSEMSEIEFKNRMKKIMPLRDWKIRGFNCHNNFEDYIESNQKNIYIVDFLEIHDNFYEIAKSIRKIHEKLGDSLCFICIQMKAGGVLGRGGDFSAEKARLYLTMDYVPAERSTKLTIYDAKQPRVPYESIRGYWRYIKVINGSTLQWRPADEWKR